MAKPPERHWLDAPDWWKQWKPLRWMAVGLIVAGVASGIKIGHDIVVPKPHPDAALYTEPVEPRVDFMGMFTSSASVADAQQVLGKGGFKSALSSAHREPTPARPPFNFDTLTVASFRHYDCAGELSLEFFNNRLYEAVFVPKDVTDYSKALRKIGLTPRIEDNGRAEMVQGPLRVAANVDFALTKVGTSLRTKPFALWQDLRLLRQRDGWSKKYGGAPAASVEETEAPPEAPAAEPAPPEPAPEAAPAVKP